MKIIMMTLLLLSFGVAQADQICGPSHSCGEATVLGVVNIPVAVSEHKKDAFVPVKQAENRVTEYVTNSIRYVEAKKSALSERISNMTVKELPFFPFCWLIAIMWARKFFFTNETVFPTKRAFYALMLLVLAQYYYPLI